MDHILSVYLLMDTDGFYFLAVVNNAAMKVDVQILLQFLLSLLLFKYPELDCQINHVVVPCLIILGTTIQDTLRAPFSPPFQNPVLIKAFAPLNQAPGVLILRLLHPRTLAGQTSLQCN